MKTLYIIPGLGETTRRRPYQLLRKIAQEKGYEVIFKNVDWKKPLYPQKFEVQRDSIVFGFSLGAILAWMVAQNNVCRHLILASMTPHYSFTNPEIKKALIELVGVDLVEDVIKNLIPKHKAEKQTIIYGDKEEEKADILVKDTQHELTANYLEEVKKLL